MATDKKDGIVASATVDQDVADSPTLTFAAPTAGCVIRDGAAFRFVV